MNRQYGIGISKYVVIFDPPPTGHLTRACAVSFWLLTWTERNFEALYLHH